MRLIDADALMRDLEKWLKQADQKHSQETNAIQPIEDIVVSTLMTIEKQPTIEERKTGKWIGQTPFVDTEECSCCGYNIVSKEMETPYCPNCGADMRIIGTGEQNG